MKCPKCGNENPDTEQICARCSCTLNEEVTGKPHVKSKAKMNKWVSVSILLTGLTGGLTIFVNPILTFLFALSTVATAVTGLIKVKRSQGKQSGKIIAIVVVIISSATFVLRAYWQIDAGPITNDYTISDLRSASAEYNRSFTVLKSLANESNDVPKEAAIGLSEQDVEWIKEFRNLVIKDDYNQICRGLDENKETILLLWQKAERGRDIIDELDSFPEIADLTEPSLDAEFGYLGNLRSLVYLCRLYVSLQVESGNEQTAVGELIKFDSVFKKLNLNARMLVTKLVCIAALANNIFTANFITNCPETSQESLELLAGHFQPLTQEQVSLRNLWISEYLMNKYELTKISKNLKFGQKHLLKLNSSLRLYKNFCDNMIAIEDASSDPKGDTLSVWPLIYPQLPVTIDPNGEFPWYYKAYNPVGSTLLMILTPAYETILQVRTRLQIHSDLLQIVLNKRLGREVSLKARAYSDEYIIDVEGGKIFSPGPDGEPNTEDDIKLMINPEVFYRSR